VACWSPASAVHCEYAGFVELLVVADAVGVDGCCVVVVTGRGGLEEDDEDDGEGECHAASCVGVGVPQ